MLTFMPPKFTQVALLVYLKQIAFIITVNADNNIFMVMTVSNIKICLFIDYKCQPICFCLFKLYLLACISVYYQHAVFTSTSIKLNKLR